MAPVHGGETVLVEPVYQKYDRYRTRQGEYENKVQLVRDWDERARRKTRARLEAEEWQRRAVAINTGFVQTVSELWRTNWTTRGEMPSNSGTGRRVGVRVGATGGDGQ